MRLISLCFVFAGLTLLASFLLISAGGEADTHVALWLRTVGLAAGLAALLLTGTFLVRVLNRAAEQDDEAGQEQKRLTAVETRLRSIEAKDADE